MTATRFHRNATWIGALLLLLAGCSSGPVRRISEPAASIQQLTVRADGNWDVQVRLNNFSSVPMRFTATNIQVAFDNGAAATLQAQPQIAIGPESADVFTTTTVPLPEGRARIATTLADGRSLNYTLGGTVDAGPEDGKSRSYKIKLSSALTPVPGLPGVLR
ncbi:hypothetical protein [Thermomonas sp. HDW16]|uniref:hypothetical protein n=1 Tax=Thermomonas sp. HDW16 TaxID=2714945 RepID=UPI00140832C1|nr:hypothetical protein [Thermomonas sp. HDW16]QIL20103.1 hypothetical protein G7079_04770 [Thermomonas sp. HDW16]